MSSPEIFKGSGETSPELQKAAGERSAELQKDRERNKEQSPDGKAESIEANRERIEAIFSKETGREHSGGEPGSGPVAVKRIVTDDERRKAYTSTMRHVQSEMSAPSRAFSKFIHHPTVERASGVVGSTVARPNAVLSGSTCALVFVVVLYIVAKIFGYPLSGFETIGAFIVGWIAGIVYDYLRVLITGRA